MARTGRKKSEGIRWTSDSLTPTLARFTIRANVAINAAAKELAEAMEQYMKENAPWDDRTHDARSGLTAEPNYGGFKAEIDLYHTVDYGIWLEVRWNGRFAIIVPTLEHFENLVWPYFKLIFPAASVAKGLLR